MTDHSDLEMYYASIMTWILFFVLFMGANVVLLFLVSTYLLWALAFIPVGIFELFIMVRVNAIRRYWKRKANGQA